MDKQNSCRPSSSLRIPARIRANPLFWPYIRHTLAAGKAQLEQPRKEEQISLKRKIEIPHKPERLVIDLDEEESEHSSRSRKNPRLVLKEKQRFANATVDREGEAGKEFSTNKYNKSWEPNINKQQSQPPSPTSTSTFAGSEVAHVSAGYSSLAMATEGLSMATNLTSLKHYSPQDEEEERRNGVSTRLKLYEDPWKIKKILKHDDILGNQCWIMVVSGSVVKEHVLKFLSYNLVRAIESNANGGRFDFWDIDTKFMHKLVLKKLIDTTYYVLIERWSQDFVKRRNLTAGDQIGFCWDTYHSRFNFCVLTRADTLHQSPTPSFLFN